MNHSPPSGDRPAARFGAFGGVFTPCTLTILGVIMFLRYGEVVGNAGIWNALLIVVIAKLITSLTALSLSAIATNTRVRGGGAYFLISRSLGVEFGGSIGLVFFVAQATSVAMYVIGFTEALVAALPGVDLPPRLVATLVNVVVFACVYLGAGWAIKVQYGILALLGLALVSFFIGAGQVVSATTLGENLAPDYDLGHDFFTMFALFFPAATGIMAGANMSGDLKQPGRAIPRGTLASIGVTGLIYLGMAVLLGAAADHYTLTTNNLVVRDTAWIPLLITLGIFAATLSSALGSMLGAPRILQALARDQVFRRLALFGHGSGINDEPRRAVVLTLLIAQAGIMLGDLNAIAPIITMFFLITYGYLNLATFYESITKNPSYRPTFRYSHWSTALLGTAGCGLVMVLISPLWASVAILAMLVLHWYIDRREIIAHWGDVKSGATFERARKNLLQLEEDAYHPKNWRPTILALSGRAWTRVQLAVYGHWLTGGRGVLTLAQVLKGNIGIHFQRRAKQEASLRDFIRDQELSAFPAVLVAPNLALGIEALVQCYGIGAFRPNVVLLGWSSRGRAIEFCDTLRAVAGLKRSIVLVRSTHNGDDPWLPPRGPIDVWWRGKANGHLMLLLAHLLVENDAWRGRRVRLLRLISSEVGQETATRHLTRLIHDARIDATPEILVGTDFFETIRITSGAAAAVVLGFQPPETGRDKEFVQRMEKLMTDLGTAIVVWSAGGMRLDA
ncbi:MAG: APC family permease [Planctomycetota bacterium]